MIVMALFRAQFCIRNDNKQANVFWFLNKVYVYLTSEILIFIIFLSMTIRIINEQIMKVILRKVI